MAIEIKEMVIKTSVESFAKKTDVYDHENELSQIKNDIIKECVEKLKEYLARQIQR